MRRFAFLCVLALAACAKDPSPTFEVKVSTPDNSHVKPSLFSGYDTPLACEKAGGAWIARCVPNTESCVMPWPDGGRSCADSSECASKTCMIEMIATCLPGVECKDPVIPAAGTKAVGICKRQDVFCGSYIEIKNGIAQEAYHVD